MVHSDATLPPILTKRFFKSKTVNIGLSMQSLSSKSSRIMKHLKNEQLLTHRNPKQTKKGTAI